MAIIDDILRENKDRAATVAGPQQEKNSWVSDLIGTRNQGGPRKKYSPVGFDFERPDFDVSSYYRTLDLYKNISTASTAVSAQDAYNKQAKEAAASQKSVGSAMGGISAKFTHDGEGGVNYSSGTSKKYKLGRVSSNTAAAADYFGNKYGITNIGGYRSSGSVPGSDHPKGRGLDYMTNNIKNGKQRGDALANDLIKNHKKWNVKYIIWYRYIWSPGRGWRKYSGPSPHTDHVHASFNK